ncbi:probable E3 ubiquitin-protein ligase XERICO [Musa acuminata AAA Group]|uniref:probable E3 ubiquitin-protein ligase XERICO n=1 Tax=Musa acuminata AAA Group TaxID=214697 RepID=UPI0031D88B08
MAVRAPSPREALINPSVALHDAPPICVAYPRQRPGVEKEEKHRSQRIRSPSLFESKASIGRISTASSPNPTSMGLSSLPTPSESVLTLVLVNTAFTVAILKELLRSTLHLLRFRAPPPPPPPQAEPAGGGTAEPTLIDQFRSRSRPVRFGSALGRRRAPAERPADCRVCLARFEPESMVNRLPCGHLFHKACLETWLDYHHATCPLCRTHVLPGEEPTLSSSVSTFSWPWF